MINLYGLESNISKNPYVEKAVVFLTIRGELKTAVKQRTPIVRIIQDDEVYYVDKQGVKVPLSENYSARVLLVSGVKNDVEMKEIMPLISTILEDNFLEKEIVGVEKLKNGEVQLAVRSGDYKIDFGTVSEIESKFRKLKAFYNKTFSDKTIQNYKLINVKYHNQVVCTK
ncbi:cell division protein FtsQ/DivIB [Polaribacter gangjinensis]|uniref:cell division protein FtsQ/DivIB n=1 Tax=Polaribacter gangjinensis TaxID=574710 RepID=UPI001D000954|nr:cell division protein FtsQ [Polaribacter gangjinensis]